MKVLVMSDTHGDVKRATHLIKHLQSKGTIDVVMHCGDCISDAKKLSTLFPDITFHMVPGNNDPGAYGSGTDLLVDVGGVPIYMTHGHKQNVYYDTEELLIDAKAHEAKVVLYGHTHRVLKENIEGILVLNPGSLRLPRDYTYGTFAILDIEYGAVKNTRIFFQKGLEQVEPHAFY